MQIRFLRYNKIYYIFTGILALASIFCLVRFGLNMGIDFTGGSILEINYQDTRPSNAQINEKLADLELGTIYIQPSEEKSVIIRMKDIDEETHQVVLQRLREGGEIEEGRFESVGPIIGRELKEKTKILVIVALLAIVLYIAIAFRRVQRPLHSWQYGIASLVALFHDVLIVLGVFSLLGKFYGIQITVPVVAALLTVIGYSINNVVVVFDRIRESLIKRVGVIFEETVEKSLNQTLTRCFNTSLTTLFPLLAIYFLGGETLKYFALTLAIGIVAGFYSAIFLASPLLVAWQARRKKI
jgi:preprotein translocase subunit SecF